MTLERAAFPRQKDVFIVNDVPVKVEITNGDKFSAISNLNMLTAFRKGGLDIYSETKPEYNITSKDIWTTYLDYTYYAEGIVDSNFDFNKEFKKRKDLKEVDGELFWDKPIVSGDLEQQTIRFHKLEHQKDVYIADRLYNELQALLTEIESVKPKLIIVTGKWSLFLLTGCTSLVQNMGTIKDKKPFGGLARFRASILQIHEVFNLSTKCILMPIYHTVNAISMPDKQFIMDMDIQKVCYTYGMIKSHGVNYFIRNSREYITGTELTSIIEYLEELLQKLDLAPLTVSIDIETMFWSVIDCIGIAHEIDRGLCIPFSSKNKSSIWTIEEESILLDYLRRILLHKNIRIIGQNFSYDAQYFNKLLGIRVDAQDDTMVLAHVLRNYLPKDLGFLASLYCDKYSYWKENVTATEESPETRWMYNIDDVCYTLEVLEAEKQILEQEDKALQDFYSFQQHEVSPALVNIMNRGVKVDLKKKQELLDTLSALLIKVEQDINNILGFEINLKSSQQIKNLFTDYFSVKPITNRKTKSASFGSDAMLIYMEEYPLLKPLITLILEYRSIGIFVRTFLSARVDDDNRMRTAYNVAGTRTYRLSSRKNAFGAGMNLQNVPSKGKIDLKYSLLNLNSDAENEDEHFDIIDSVDITDSIYGDIQLPNCKELFICEEDEVFFDIDLAAADARIIAWISRCKFLTDLFEDPNGDIYLTLAKEYYKDPSVTKKDYRRQIFKAICHGSNYLGKANTLAAKAGLLIHEVDKVQKFYFSICPEIPKLHKYIENQVRTVGYLTNCWGARGWVLDKKDPMILNKAMAWVGSSPVGILINKGLVNIEKYDKDIKVLLQVHDSLAGIYKQSDITAPERIKQYCSIPLPYEVPRIIPVNIKTGASYGSCG